MALRYLFGPIDKPTADQLLQIQHERGNCLTFNTQDGSDLTIGLTDTWADVSARLPSGFAPDFIALYLPYRIIPTCLWSAPLPIVGLAVDWNLLWHYYRRCLPLCDLVLTDTPGTQALACQGLDNVRIANLYGCEGAYLQPPLTAPQRDIDILFVGNFNPAVQGERLRWLGRLGALADRWRVVLTTGVYHDDYRALLARARIVFNRSIRGECNQRAFEATGAGALLFQEAENREVGQYFHDRKEYVAYGSGDLEELLIYYLEHEDERRAIAEAGRQRVQHYTFGTLWEGTCEQIHEKLDGFRGRPPSKPPSTVAGSLLLRTWQALQTYGEPDTALTSDLQQTLVDQPRCATLYHALAMALALEAHRRSSMDRSAVLKALRQALYYDPTHVMAGLNLAEALVGAGQISAAVQQARRTLAILRRFERLSPQILDSAHLPPAYDHFRVEWERAAWQNAGQPEEEAKAKKALIRWRLHSLLATHTGELAHYNEAAVTRPDLLPTQAALGCALARIKKFDEALPHLESAVAGNPFDVPAASALFQVLGEAEEWAEQHRLRCTYHLLHQAAPKLVASQEWFASAIDRGAAPERSMQNAEDRAQNFDQGPVVWEGIFQEFQSLALVNRELCQRLVERGFTVALRLGTRSGPAGQVVPLPLSLAAAIGRPLERPVAVHVRHQWPPRWTAPPEGHWVVMQPWEFGSLPRAWIKPLRDQVDELWVPTTYVRDCFIKSGVPADRIQVVPNGVDVALLAREQQRFPLRTAKRFKFLFVGGTLHRKGIDILLRAYMETFTSADDACLVIKDMGAASFYRGQTAEREIAAIQSQSAPEIEYLPEELSTEQMAALYQACDCLVHPYRGEGFGLPMAEAMACNLPVIVTGYGAALDFCDDTRAYLLPARLVQFNAKKLGDLETVDVPWLAEPDLPMLRRFLRYVFEHPDEARAKGQAGASYIRKHFSWDRAADVIAARLQHLRNQPIRRLGRPTAAVHQRVDAEKRPSVIVNVHGHPMELHDPTIDRWISAPLANGRSYEPFQTKLALDQLQPGDRVLDIGANIGYYTLLFARQVGPSGRVFAVEPDPANFGLLRRNVARNGYSNVILINKAAADKNQTARLFKCADNQGDHRLCADDDPRESVEVETGRLDTLVIDASPLALVKLDVQGSEGLVLAGMQELLKCSPAVRVMLEFWPWGLARSDTPPKAVLNQLSSLGFSFHLIDEIRGCLVPFEATDLLRLIPMHKDRFVNLFCTRRKGIEHVIGQTDEGLAASARLAVDDVPLGPHTAAKPSVSLCMIVRNEESHLQACLASVADLVDEIIVVDTGSTDRTKEIAEAAGARVYDFAWVDSFAAARNESLRHATGDWILWLDADERLDETNRQRLRDCFLTLTDENVAFVMRQLSQLEAGTYAAAQVDQVRLFRNRPDIRWQYRVHEQILMSVRSAGGEVRFTDIIIDHAGFKEAEVQGPKVQRNLRLLELELAEHPDDAFVLYNLGAVRLTQGQSAEALDLLQRSIKCSEPGNVLVRKLHALITRAHHQLGHNSEAIAACRTGLLAFPDDGELLFWEAMLLREQKNLGGAAACLERVLKARPSQHFTSVDAGLYSYRARYFLAETYRDLGRLDEAELQWKAAVAECPSFAPAWLELAKLYFQCSRWNHLSEALSHVKTDSQLQIDALVLNGRAALARKEFAAAKEYLQAATGRAPEAIMPRVLLSHALLQEELDWATAQEALLDVLALDPGNREAQHNLRLLRQQHPELEKTQENLSDCSVSDLAVAACPPDSESVSGTISPKVSLCMIVRNEEANLPDCLDSIADLVNEMIVVDTGSTDHTKEIASQRGANVFDFPWINHFSAARNECLRHATGQWIFWMDADDRLDEENRAKLRALFASLKNDMAGFVMKCLCVPDSNGVATVVDHLRLFRNHPEARWTFRVHEQILPSLRRIGVTVQWSDVVIHHTGYQDPAMRHRKLKRDLRLLQLELADQPDHPFTLFNLGSVTQELGRTAEALKMFERSLERSAPQDSIVRKLYATITQCHRALGQQSEALAACRAGLDLFSDDVELLFQEGVTLRETGDVEGAIRCWERCLQAPQGMHFASVNTGLRGHITRHNLAAAYFDQHRHADAESQWKAALAERPHYEAAWRGLLTLYLEQHRWPEVEQLAGATASNGDGQLQRAVIYGRLHLARKEFSTARQVLGDAIRRSPRALEPQILLSHALLQEAKDWQAAEGALRGILAIDPQHSEAKHNLSVLLKQRASA
jgi:FkbM family methyltransferase